MAVSGIDHDHVHARFDQCFDAFVSPLAHADCGTDAQAALIVFTRKRMFAGFLNILHRDQTAQLEIFIDDQHALQAMAMQQGHRFGARRAFAHRHQTLARRHDIFRRLIEIGFKTQIAVGDNPDHGFAVHYRQAGNFVTLGEGQHFAHGHVRRNRIGIFHYAAFEAFHFRDFRRLQL